MESGNGAGSRNEPRKREKTCAVGQAFAGCSKTTGISGIGGAGSMISPIPRKRAGAECKHTGTSAPSVVISAGKYCACLEMPHHSSNPQITEPASLDPPPIPEESG